MASGKNILGSFESPLAPHAGHKSCVSKDQQISLSKRDVQMRNDESWFPGKVNRDKYGPKQTLTGRDKNSIAKSAMAMKRKLDFTGFH